MITQKGQSIEDRSMEIIENEFGSHSYSPDEWTIVKRIIHSTADFDFARDNKVIFQNDAIRIGIEALQRGCNIVADVNAVIGGFNKDNLKKFGNNVICKISDPRVVNEAMRLDKTRAQTSMRIASEQMNQGIAVIGNAPTALLEVIKMVKEGVTSPSLVIGIPVGFVCAVESKDDLRATKIPYITNIGRKGGSSCASAIINALYKILIERTRPKG
jgi:precorrin-8X/cobalt-precorrin-8 methylmutase